MQITIMIDTQQQYIKLNIRGEISIMIYFIGVERYFCSKIIHL